MADFDFNDEIVTLSGFDGFGISHDSVEVVVTATMKQGSLLKADGTEAATADAAAVVGVLDDLMFRRHRDELAVDDTILVAVAKRGLVLNEAVLTYTDGAIDAAGKAALAAGMNKFASVANDATIV